MDGTGQGPAAAYIQRVRADGTQSIEPAVRYDETQGAYVAAPIDPGPETDRVYLVLYGTGIRFRSSLIAVNATVGGVAAVVVYAGAQGTYPGIDQVNVLLPRSLPGAGEVGLTLTVDGHGTNTVTIVIG